MDYVEKLKRYQESSLAIKIKESEKENERILDDNKIHFIRCDGRHFKTFTKGFKKPFDEIFRNTMNKTMIALCEEIQGSIMGFTQSDEITIMFKKKNKESELPFSGRVTKIETSASASCTLFFNKFFMEEVSLAKEKLRDKYREDDVLGESEIQEKINEEFSIYEKKFLIATFDARVFSKNTLEEAREVFIWRILDCYKNAIQMIARTQFSNKELTNKKTNDMKVMLLKNGVDIYQYSNRNMYGVVAIKEEKLLYAGTNRECIRNKYTLKDSLETIFSSNEFDDNYNPLEIGDIILFNVYKDGKKCGISKGEIISIMTTKEKNECHLAYPTISVKTKDGKIYDLAPYEIVSQEGGKDND